jgi:hypothetical protein
MHVILVKIAVVVEGGAGGRLTTGAHILVGGASLCPHVFVVIGGLGVAEAF